MNPIVIVGSGPSGVHCAKTLLEKGRRVVMLDVGRKKPPAVRPELPLVDLKHRLDDPADYFLGRQYEALILPDSDREYYGLPPSKNYVIEPPDRLGIRTRGFAPLVSFASGGLAEAWTGGCYAFTAAELEQFPFGFEDLAPYYERVAERIVIAGADDDMARFFPLPSRLDQPLRLDDHSRALVTRYERRRTTFNQRFRCYLGRSRVSVLSRDRNGRRACDYLGRCLWGCPRKSLYTPSLTLEECRADERFEYVDGMMVSHFRFDHAGRVRSVVARELAGGRRCEFPVGSLVLAAGTLGSSRIFLESVYRDSGERRELPGLMDNRQVMMPFVNLRMLGRSFAPGSYQYHQLAVGVEGDTAADMLHGQITTLKTALTHPLIQTLPAALGTGVRLFRDLHAALGLVNINFSDHRRRSNMVALEADPRTGATRLAVTYSPAADEPKRVSRACRTFRKLLRKLGCVAPRKMTRRRPMGASVHYCGTIPMTASGSTCTADAQCRSRDFENLYFVDGTTFPWLPAKNLTYTLMANASRVAEEAF